MWITLAIVAVCLLLILIYDLVQTRHAVLRNFPLIGHFRYLLEAIGPELRQYIVTDNDEERPFSRDQRTWVYTSAKRLNNYFGFGTDNEPAQEDNYLIIKHSAFPLLDPHPDEAGYDPQYTIPCAKVLGGWRRRRHAFRPASVVNVSAMSFGSLSGAAVEALNRGCQQAGCLHNTGEGGISPHHQKGGDLIWQLGTGYFGCRDRRGGFDLEACVEAVAANQVKAIEIKLSQGAKPGLGGVLPKAKITPEIARIRGIEQGRDCISPARHTAFHDVDSMLDFVETLADRTGVPVGIKSAVGELTFWQQLADRMAATGRGVDFVTVDGGEGGTGAAPLAFSDHVSFPFRVAMARVYGTFAEVDLHHRVVFIGSGKLGFPETAMIGFALGCDLLAVAREAMMAVGCIQAQRCHTGHCPTGVATQNRWLVRGLDPTDKAARLANYVMMLRKELLRLSRACGESHPALVGGDHLEFLDAGIGGRPLREVFGYGEGWGFPSAEDRRLIHELMVQGPPKTDANH